MVSSNYQFFIIDLRMIWVLGLRGDTLVVYALIASFSRGSSGGYYGNYKQLADCLRINERTVKDIIPKLMKAQYITRVEKPLRGRASICYYTNYEKLLQDVEAGSLPIIPCSKRREVYQPVVFDHLPGGQIPLAAVTKDHLPGGQIPLAAVVKDHQPGGQIPPYIKYKNKDRLRMFIDCCSNKESDYNEDNDFYVIFFVLDAFNPEKEVQDFVNFNYRYNWQDSKNRRYRSLKSRVSLAYSYANKETTAKGRSSKNARDQGLSISNESLIRKFLICLMDLYCYASENHLEGLDPRLILNPNSFCDFRPVHDSKYDLIWYVGKNTKRWMEMHYDDLTQNVIKAHFPDMENLRFEIAASRLKMI